MADHHEQAAMRRALDAAREATENALPNPRVGCVLLSPDGATLAVGARLISGTLTVNRITLIVWSILLVLVLPSAVVVTGFVNRYRRRKK